MHLFRRSTGSLDASLNIAEGEKKPIDCKVLMDTDGEKIEIHFQGTDGRSFSRARRQRNIQRNRY